jgi:integrase
MDVRFRSVLRDALVAFMELIALSVADHRAYRSDLADFDSFLAETGQADKSFTADQVSSWLDSLDVGASTKKIKLSHVRRFSGYLRTLGIMSSLPELPRSHAAQYDPYIFTIEEMQRIFAAADELVLFRPDSLIAAQFPMFLRIVYGCGLRAGEALRLTWDDVNLQDGVLTIREAKNQKQRLVPMSEELTRILRLYRTSPVFKMKVHDQLFKKNDNTPRCPSAFSSRFREFLYDLGIKGAHTRCFAHGPCIHSFRHVFVLHSLLKAEAEGRSFMETVPFLSTYLGHARLMETDRYLRARYDFFKVSHVKIAKYTESVFPEVDDPWLGD